MNAALDAGDPLGNERVADQNDGKWDHKPKHQGQDVVSCHAGSPTTGSKVLKTCYCVPHTPVVEGTSEDEWDHDAQSNHPKHCNHHHVMDDLDLDVGEGMQHRDVAVHTDAGEKGDAEADVDVVQSPSYPAGYVPKDPVVPIQVVMNFEGQHAHKQGVHQN